MMKLLKYVNFLLIAVLSLVLFGCDGHSDDPTLPPSADGLEQNLDYNEDGTFNEDYIDNVTLNVWSVIGAPDKTTWENLIREFNIEYDGKIKVNLISHGHEVFYTSLENTKVNNPDEFPDVVIMHNEKTIQYAADGYFYAVDDLIDAVKIDYSFDQVYDNIERTTIHEGKHYGIPMDAHGYLTNIRQDIIKKNELGFDNNTRFVQQTYAEYQTLLEGLYAKAQDGSLWVRNIASENDHSWYKIGEGNNKLVAERVVTKENFSPAFMFNPENEILTALYVNGGSLLDASGKVNFHNNTLFQKYLTDIVNRFNSGLYGDAGGGVKDFVFPQGKTVMFSEGPWWVANSYDGLWNNSELTKAGEKGVTAEDAADPVYSHPYVVSRATWLAQEGAPAENANKWYGNGHVITYTNKIKDLEKAAAALVFAKWVTQGKDGNGDYNLAKWANAGHLPAWKNVYDSDSYRAIAANNMTLQALGDPANIISLESTKYATYLTTGVVGAVGDVHAQLLDANAGGCNAAQALEILRSKASLTQETIDMMSWF